MCFIFNILFSLILSQSLKFFVVFTHKKISFSQNRNIKWLPRAQSFPCAQSVSRAQRNGGTDQSKKEYKKNCSYSLINSSEVQTPGSQLPNNKWINRHNTNSSTGPGFDLQTKWILGQLWMRAWNASVAVVVLSWTCPGDVRASLIKASIGRAGKPVLPAAAQRAGHDVCEERL